MTQQQNKPTDQPEAPEVDRRFQPLLTLISLLKSARNKTKKTELEFMIVNQTFNLVPYRHCVLWEYHDETVFIQAISGLVQIDPHGPYTLWLKKVTADFLKRKVANKVTISTDKPGEKDSSVIIVPASSKDCQPDDAAEWKQWMSEHCLLLAMKDARGKVFGGLWFDREGPFNPLEHAVLEDLCDGYAHALQRFEDIAGRRKTSGWKSLFRLTRSNVIRLFFVLSAVMIIPVRMSSTAPAEVVAKNPTVVSIPFDGIVEKVEVLPGQAVKEGDVILRMDSTMLKSRAEMAAGDEMTAEVALRKTEREALTDRTKLADIAILKAQLAQKSAEKKFSQERLERSEIKAERDGIVIFSDPNALHGKPVQTGEQVMYIADPQDSELLIRMPIESMIEINEEIPVKFFLNVMPAGFREASYESIGYQATQDPDGLMTYKIRANFTGDEEKPRIGWTGTGKIYGERTLLILNILRRPAISLRQKLGI